jgi:hypothetical protein
MVDTEQHLDNLQQVNELRLKNDELKKELEREQILHKMLYKDWQKLTAEMSEQKEEIYENSRPKNLFYKYAFYVLLIVLVAVFYFLYPRRGYNKPASSNVISDTVHPANSAQTKAAATTPNSLPKKDSISSVQKTQINNSPVKPQPLPVQSVTQPEEKKTITLDSAKTTPLINHKSVLEAPLTDDAKDSISALGFSAYFDHRRNPFRRSSEKYKVWAEGWNQGKAEGKKLEGKDPSLKH